MHKAPSANVCDFPLVVNVAKSSLSAKHSWGTGVFISGCRQVLQLITLGFTPKMHLPDSTEACKHVTSSITYMWVLLACRGRMGAVEIQVINNFIKIHRGHKVLFAYTCGAPSNGIFKILLGLLCCLLRCLHTRSLWLHLIIAHCQSLFSISSSHFLLSVPTPLSICAIHSMAWILKGSGNIHREARFFSWCKLVSVPQTSQPYYLKWKLTKLTVPFHQKKILCPMNI